jgi:hypothetical protein
MEIQMTTTTPRTDTRRSPATKITIALLFLLGITALGGGTAMVLGLGNESTMLPDEWLTEIPLIDSWVIPGLVLGIGFGVGALMVGYGMFRRPDWTWTRSVTRLTGHHWSWAATLLIGGGHVLWILLQLVFLPDLSALQAIYGTIGVALATLPTTRAVRADLRVPPSREPARS